MEETKETETKEIMETKKTEIIKAKRGRKINKKTNEEPIQLNIVEIESPTPVFSSIVTQSEPEPIQSEKESIVTQPEPEPEPHQEKESIVTQSEKESAVKKRGRKPKGGKIIQHIVSDESQKDDKPNVILHLRCSMKDLKTFKKEELVESYGSFSNFEMIESNQLNPSGHAMQPSLTGGYDNDNEEVDDNNNNNNKDVWKKLRQLEHDLHINNVNNKRSCCFWDTCEFDNPPVYIPKHFINGSYHVYGCFCSPECGVAHLMNENLDSSTKFERYHLMNHIYSKIYDYKKNIKPAADPHYMLEKYYGNLTIQEYRKLLRNERLFMIVDKPLTRILPELHEDNDIFMLNNKTIQTNGYKARMQRKKNKTTILNETFGIGTVALGTSEE